MYTNRPRSRSPADKHPVTASAGAQIPRAISGPNGARDRYILAKREVTRSHSRETAQQTEWLPFPLRFETALVIVDSNSIPGELQAA